MPISGLGLSTRVTGSGVWHKAQARRADDAPHPGQGAGLAPFFDRLGANVGMANPL